MTGWQWHQLDHMQIICTLLQTDNHASTSTLSFVQAGCSSFLPPNQQRQSTEGIFILHYYLMCIFVLFSDYLKHLDEDSLDRENTESEPACLTLCLSYLLLLVAV